MSLLRNKYGGTRFGFAVLLKFFKYQGRFPKAKSEISPHFIDYIAKQVGVSMDLFDEYGYGWEGRSIKYHRAQICNYMRFRDCALKDLELLKSWLQANILPQEMQIDRIREQVLHHLRKQHIVPPAPDHLERNIKSAIF